MDRFEDNTSPQPSLIENCSNFKTPEIVQANVSTVFLTPPSDSDDSYNKYQIDYSKGTDMLNGKLTIQK